MERNGDFTNRGRKYTKVSHSVRFSDIFLAVAILPSMHIKNVIDSQVLFRFLHCRFAFLATK